MTHRKRRPARPMLEAIEPRIAPSAIGITVHHHEKAAPAVVRQASASAEQAEASIRKNNEALRSLQQQEHLVYVHSREKIPSALPTKAQQEATQVSNFVKDLQSAI